MPKHIVTCMVCKQKFDINAVEFVYYNEKHTRYAHKACMPNGELVKKEVQISTQNLKTKTEFQEFKDSPEVKQAQKDTEDYKKLTSYIDILYHKKVNWGMVGMQIRHYHSELGYSYTGMLHTLQYAYGVRKEDITRCEGVGIIPLRYQEAHDYYYSIWQANITNEQKRIPRTIKTNTIIIPPPTCQPMKKRNLFSFLDEE